jgi:membrane-bound lytic murein transglycosylase C
MKTRINNKIMLMGIVSLLIPLQPISDPHKVIPPFFSSYDEFKEYKKSQAIQYSRFVAQSNSEFDQWLDDNDKQFKTFKNAIIKEWGVYVSSSNKQWVEFSPSTKSCSIVDFAKGSVTVKALLQPHDSTEKAVKKELGKAIEQVLTSKGSIGAIPICQKDSVACALSRPILADQVVDENGRTVTPGDVDAFAKQTAEHAAIAATSVPDSSQVEYVLKFPLAPDHVVRRMRAFVPLVKKYCLKYDLNPAHVLAIIHTESYFNPMARSSENAIGLMQLVPEKGAREAWEFINRSGDPAPRAEYLYDPEKNIELGCAYLCLLKTRDFGEVSDEQCRMYCSIAGYNTGSGNVAYAFIGKRKLAPAIQAINSIHSPDRIYEQLIHNLPVIETRNYLENVIERVHLYQ